MKTFTLKQATAAARDYADLFYEPKSGREFDERVAHFRTLPADWEKLEELTDPDNCQISMGEFDCLTGQLS